MQIEVRFLLACELVSHTREGKLNIMGEFNRLANPKLPFALPMMYVVGRVDGSLVAGLRHSAQLIVTDEDGAVIWKSPPIAFEFAKPGNRDHPMRANLIFQLGGMVFPKYGTYSFTLWIDGTSRETVLVFVQAPEAKAPADAG